MRPRVAALVSGMLRNQHTRVRAQHLVRKATRWGDGSDHGHAAKLITSCGSLLGGVASREANTNSPPDPSLASFTNQPLLTTIPPTNAVTSPVTSHWTTAPLVVPVGARLVAVDAKSPPELVHAVMPSRVFQVTPLFLAPVPSVQLASARWTLYVRDVVCTLVNVIFSVADAMQDEEGIDERSNCTRARLSLVACPVMCSPASVPLF